MASSRHALVHVTSLARSNKKLGILGVMNNMHGISIVSEANGDIAITSDNVEKRTVILKIDAAKRRLYLRLVLRQRLGRQNTISQTKG